MIIFEDVTKKYNVDGVEIPVIVNLSFSISQADFLVVRGPSGSGKTTLLRLIGGLTTPNTGIIKVVRNNLQDKTQEQLAIFRAAYIGFVFQDFHLISTLTCLENVMLPLELSGALNNEARESAITQLKKIGLEHRINHFPHQLSGGEQQRTTWARAQENNPAIIMADEPTANLDQKTRQFIINSFKELKNDPYITVVVVTNDPIIESLASCYLDFDEGIHFTRITPAPELPKEEETEEETEESELNDTIIHRSSKIYDVTED